MCKFTNRLFVFALLHLAASKPVHVIKSRSGPVATRSLGTDLLDLMYNDYPDYGYQQEEIHYDQRQKGEENLQLRLDGFLIGAPAFDDDSTLLSMLVANNLENIEMKNSKAQSSPNQLYQTEPPLVLEPSTQSQIINIPSPKKGIESRQHSYDEVVNATRTKAHLMQLLQMFRRPIA